MSDIGIPMAERVVHKATGIAGNVVTTITVPAGKRWKVEGVKIVLTTDATVATRTPRVIHYLSTAEALLQVDASTQAASLGPTPKYWEDGYIAVNGTINFLRQGILRAGDYITLSIGSGVAGDAYDYVVTVLQVVDA